MDDNARLIAAVQRATRKLASSAAFDTLLQEVLTICVEAVGASHGTVYQHDPATQRLRFLHVFPADIRDLLPGTDIPDDYGVAGLAFQTRKSQTRVFAEKPMDEWNEFEQATGVQVRSIIATPLSMEDEEPIGVVQLINKDDGPFTEIDVAVLDTVSAVATMAYLNAQLLDEQARASTLLGMGKVSHDISNLAASLFATLSFGDMAMSGLNEHLLKQKPDRTVRMYAEALAPMFQELRESVNRIVGYSELISDMSAGRPLRPKLRPLQLAEIIHDAAGHFESQGRSEYIEIRYAVNFGAPVTVTDEVYVARIVQNLVGNAIKAVRETLPEDLPDAPEDEAPATYFGWVDVSYTFVDDRHIISIKDTGPGMTAATVSRILSGTARSQWERAGGSGWGLKIVQELTNALGGHVEIESILGEGSTFRVVLPHHPE